jgi:hypothetical protein
VTERSRSASLVLELLIIVISILHAFAIDALWEDHQESATRSELIDLLIADFDLRLRDCEMICSATGGVTTVTLNVAAEFRTSAALI